MARTEEQKARSAENQRRYRALAKASGVSKPPLTDEQKQRQAEAQARYRERQKALGVERVLSEAGKEWQRKYMAARRLKAKEEGTELPSDIWARENPERQRQRVRNWRANNFERSQEINRRIAAKRRSTPWGRINNSMWAMVHDGINIGYRPGKYNNALGYTWRELKEHLEAQFAPDMSWENWGEVWELDHVIPLSSFRYTSIEDQEFRDCWALGNLRPLSREENATKGSKRL